MIAAHLLLALACSGGEAPQGLGSSFEDYLAPEAQYELVPRDDTGIEGLWLLRIEEGTWTLREGSRWRDANDLAAFETDIEAGLRLDEQLVLPERIEVGASFEGGSVSAQESAEVWYGVFEAAATVEIDEGRLAGRQVFAPGIGPILVTLDGEERELALYEWL